MKKTTLTLIALAMLVGTGTRDGYPLRNRDCREASAPQGYQDGLAALLRFPQTLAGRPAPVK